MALEQPLDRQTASGELAVVARVTPSPRLAYLQLQVDGVVRAMSNASPHAFALDTLAYPDGEHSIAVQVCDDAGRVLSEHKVTVFVDNQREAGE